jgi:hypothetical protein
MGMDSTERVHIGLTSKRSDGRRDFAVFRYEPPTGDRRFLGPFIDVSQAAWNLRPSEEIPKGHHAYARDRSQDPYGLAGLS